MGEWAAQIWIHVVVAAVDAVVVVMVKTMVITTIATTNIKTVVVVDVTMGNKMAKVGINAGIAIETTRNSATIKKRQINWSRKLDEEEEEVKQPFYPCPFLLNGHYTTTTLIYLYSGQSSLYNHTLLLLKRTLTPPPPPTNITTLIILAHYQPFLYYIGHTFLPVLLMLLINWYMYISLSPKHHHPLQNTFVRPFLN